MIIPRPQIEPIPTSIWEAPRFMVTVDYIITFDDGLQIVVPKGFETDFASVPRLMWALPGFASTGPLIFGSPFHDFGYQYGYLLTPYLPGHHTYPEPSMALREQFPHLFNDLIPVFVGRNQVFFDQLLEGITTDATGQRFVATSARAALYLCGGKAWNKYRTKGPSAYNSNSLGLPGITTAGVRF